MIFDSKPSIIGHRGFGAGNRGGYRENTVPSFLAAVACGLSWVELDVHRSRDGQLMVCHDPVAPSGGAIVTRTAADLAADGVATLGEVLTALPAHVAVDIDVKTIIDDAVDPPPERTQALVADVLQRRRRTRRFLVSSFDPSAVAYLAGRRDAIGEVALGLAARLAAAGVDAVCVNDIPGVQAALALSIGGRG